MILRSIPLAFAAAAFLVQPAFAQTTEEEAAAIREAMQSWIDTQLAGVEGDLRFDGELTVTPEGDLYRAVIPAFEFVMTEGSFRFEETPIEIAPREDGWYDTSFTLPEGTVLSSTGVEEGRLTIGEQSASGVFAPEIRNFISLDAELLQVEMLSTAEPGTELTIDRVLLDSAYEETEPGIYDQPGSFMVEGLALNMADGPGHFSLGRATVDFNATGIVLEEIAAFSDRFDVLATEAAGPVDEAAMMTLFADILEESGFYLSGMDISYELEDLVVEGPMGGVDRRVEVPRIGTGGYVSGLKAESTEIGFSFDLGGFSIDPPFGPFETLLPREARIDMAMVDIPTDAAVGAIAEWLRAAGPAMAGTGPKPGGDVLASPIDAMEELMATGSAGRLEIAEISLANVVSSAVFSGEAIPDMNTLMGFTADGTLTITGLDALIEGVRATGAGPEAEAALTFLRGLGTPTTTAEGEIVQVYEIEVTPDGQALVNGTDVMAYGAMGETTAPPAYEAPPPAANPKLPTAPTTPAAPAGPATPPKTPSPPVGPPAVAPGLK
ncbi:hypothetical protein [Inquilinus sp. CAU 1745]|uniref:hypothetical protein n=1 Tax=Inquilinus sp. CAU 1745 TaxID=3140369 RepID=UPI00325C16CE